MALAKIKSDEETLIEFDVQVYGTTDSLSQVRFIIEGEKYDLVCKCNETDEGGVQVTIPALKGIFEAGDYQCRLETIINDRIFTPLSESVEVLPLVEFKVNKKSVDTKETPKIKVTTKKKLATSVSLTGKSLEEAINQGAHTEYSNGATFLKVNDKYIGIVVNENKIMYADSDYSSVEQLVEAIEKSI